MSGLPAPYLYAERTLLGSGLTNSAFRLTHQNQHYFYRQGIAHPEALYIDREQERQALQIAYADGLIPEILYSSDDGQQLVMAWCEEPVWQVDYFSSAAGIARLGQLTARVHALAGQLKVLDLSDYLQRFMDDLPRLDTALKQQVVQLQTMLRASAPCRPVFCHNDINPSNLLGEKPWLIDWEYAAMGDPAFELAGICRAGMFDAAQQQLLIRVYQGAGGDCSIERVKRMLPVVDMVSLLWCEKIQLQRADKRYELLHRQLEQQVFDAERQ
ncbi:choline/ethanolamine kinase family protein [Tolumonas lignilytica]|uniref:choline/ethanolamine kinase family protein n=1 Tax=Tolumonas lignilytica TaxID=1283284 RepID=UPI0004ACE9D6|nr:choline/ethanolamine kinase family protein [Tolumonas lignilytica]